MKDDRYKILNKIKKHNLNAGQLRRFALNSKSKSLRFSGWYLVENNYIEFHVNGRVEVTQKGLDFIQDIKIKNKQYITKALLHYSLVLILMVVLIILLYGGQK